jgi:flagellar basal-body rod modification protein FlgD
MSISTDYSNKDLFINSQLRDDAGAAKTDSLGKEAFLTMMVAQLKNQDPLNPLEGTDFTAQLAQFSSLEQQITMNTNLSSILESLNSSAANDNLFDYMEIGRASCRERVS